MTRPYVGPAVHLRLTAELLSEVDAAAEADGVSRPEMVRQLLSEALAARTRRAARRPITHPVRTNAETGR